MEKGLIVPKWVLTVQPKISQMSRNLSAQFVCPSPKVWDFNQKKASLGVRSPWFFFPFYVSLGHFTHFFHFFRGDHVIPSISEAFPNPDIVKEVGLFQTFISQFSYLNLKSNKSKKRNLGMYANTSHNMHDFTLGIIQVLRQHFFVFFRPTHLRQHK